MVTYEATLFEVGGLSLTTPERVYDYMKDTLEVHPMNEVLYVILLNRKNMPLARIAVTTGTVSCTLAHPREVFRPAILGGACAIVCVHNLPSGDPAPNSADVTITRSARRQRPSILSSSITSILGRLECDPLCRGFFSFRAAGII